MTSPPRCTEATGYSTQQETAPKPPSQGWRMLLPATVVGKDEVPSPASLMAVGWQSGGEWKRGVGVCGVSAPQMGAGWQLKGGRALP